MNAIVFPLALGAGIGVTVTLGALFGPPRASDDPIRPAKFVAARARAWARANTKRLLAAALAAGLVWVLTGGWIGDTIGIGLLVWFARTIFGDAKAARARAERATAVASWTESVRSTLTASAGLEQAIIAAASFPPPGLETPTRALAAAIQSGQRVDAALTQFRSDIDDETCDIVVYTLQRAWRRGGTLADVLGRLAATARDRARMNQRISIARAGARTSLRQLTFVGLVFALVLPRFNPIMSEAFDTTAGQVLLLITDGIWAIAVVIMVRLARWERAPRLIGEDVPS